MIVGVLTMLTACGSDDGRPEDVASITVAGDSSSTSSIAPDDSVTTTVGSETPTNPPSSGATTTTISRTNPSLPGGSTSPGGQSGGGSSSASGPSIVVSSVSPSSVGVGGTVTVEFSVSDVGGISFVATFWRSSSGNQVNACPNGMGMFPTSGTSISATYQSQCTLPGSGLPSGTYMVSLLAEDTAGNRTTETTTFTVTGGSSDVTGPSIVVSSVSPSSVSLGGTVAVEFSVSDAGGISFVATFWRSSSGNQVNACPNGMGMFPTSGTSINATYQSQCTLPGSGLPSGTYTVSLLAEDTAGNRTTETTTFAVM